ncbi:MULTISPECIES: LacI family DNA-binding transcriptional regulator [unclassified Enterococcus]|uniref:LacI family DNA-binding transcriptional regulator n=1 Tax=unclassified Enterococcus TaxID=2608891 RepID=UPI0013ECD624|nr:MULTISPECIES: LacI family DNA-binding transcriptional regulator [unclassified Enterococcus]
MSSIRDVAQLAGVAVGTVSRYLNGQQLKEENREKIEAAIKTLDYKENIIAKGLKNNRSFSIGLLINGISSRFGSEVITGIEKVAEENGYSLLLSGFTGEQELISRKVDHLTKHAVDGLIVFLSEEEWSGIEELGEIEIPIVALNCPKTVNTIDSILIDDRKSVETVIRHYAASGHQKIGFIAASQTDYAARERLAGARNAIQAYPQSQLEVFTGDYSRRSGFAGAKELLEKGVTALFVSNYNMSIGVLECFNQEGVRIGQDIAFSHYDYLDKNSRSNLPQITITPPTEKIGECAADLLLKRIKNQEISAGKVIVIENEIDGINVEKKTNEERGE